MRKLLRIVLLRPVLWAASKFSSRPNRLRIFDALSKLFTDILEHPGKKGLVIPFEQHAGKFIIFSDQHKGRRNGADDFTSIAHIQASTATTGNYSYTDANAARLSQKAYYRLKMVDHDGQYKYSAVVVVTFENAASIMVTPNLLNAGEMISVNIAGNNQSKFDVKLFDMSGKMISQQAGNTRMQIATSGLRKGMYIVSVSNLNEAKTFRIMVQ